MNSKPNREFTDAIVVKLNQSSAELPFEIREKLDQARHDALLKVPKSNDNLVSNIQQQLKQTEALPADLERKLNQMRRAAVAQQANSKSWLNRIQEFCSSLLPDLSATSAIAASACLTVTIAALFYSDFSPRDDLPLDPEIGLIASADELELYENLDFYLWLAENEVLN